MIIQRNIPERWKQLSFPSLALIALTLNWFDIASAFPQISHEYHWDVSQLSSLIAVYILGFALFHIPAGMIAYRQGVKMVLLEGLFLESIAAILCSCFPGNLLLLIIFRFIAGIGGALIVGMALSLITSWFRGKELVKAMSLSGAGCFTVGQVLALASWTFVIQTLGWQLALALGGVYGLVVFLLCLLYVRVPNEETVQLSAGTFAWNAVGRVVFNKDLWLIGLSFFGVYGAGLTTAQLLITYLAQVYHLSEASGGVFSAVFVIMALPGAAAGAALGRRVKSIRALFVWPWVILGLSLCLFPFLGLAGVWMMVIVAGAAQQFGFGPWSAIPAYYRDRVRPADVATAVGVLLTAGGLGGFVIPLIFGAIEARYGFSVAFVFAGFASICFAPLGFFARDPLRVDAVNTEVAPTSTMIERVLG